MRRKLPVILVILVLTAYLTACTPEDILKYGYGVSISSTSTEEVTKPIEPNTDKQNPDTSVDTKKSKDTTKNTTAQTKTPDTLAPSTKPTPETIPPETNKPAKTTPKQTDAKTHKPAQAPAKSNTLISSLKPITDYKQRYGYQSATATQKKLYTLLYNGFMASSKTIDISSVSPDLNDLYISLNLVQMDNPELLHDIRKYEYYHANGKIHKLTNFQGSYYSKETADNMRSQIKKESDAIIAKIPKNATVFDAIKIVHDEIILNTSYNLNGKYINSPYGALVEKEGVCVAYTRAFQYIMYQLGIENLTVLGTANEAHIWNMVKLDGSWYHIDLTWDDPVGLAKDYVGYTYFLVTTKQIATDHQIYPTILKSATSSEKINFYEIPQATATKYNYYVYNGITIYSDWEKALVDVKAQLKASFDGKTATAVIYASQDVYHELYDRFILTSEIAKYINTLPKANWFKGSSFHIMSSGTSDIVNEITITFKYN